MVLQTRILKLTEFNFPLYLPIISFKFVVKHLFYSEIKFPNVISEFICQVATNPKIKQNDLKSPSEEKGYLILKGQEV